jgi:hypothetical protein
MIPKALLRKEVKFLKNCAGVVKCSINRQNGRIITVYDGELAGMDTSDGRWQTVCEEHGYIICHTTRHLAIAHAADPCGWCEECINEDKNQE